MVKLNFIVSMAVQRCWTLHCKSASLSFQSFTLSHLSDHIQTRTCSPLSLHMEIHCYCWCLAGWHSSLHSLPHLFSKATPTLLYSLCICLCYNMPHAGSVTQSCPTLCTPWTVARQVPLSMGFSRQGYWSRLPFPSPGDLPNPGIEPESPALAGGFFITEPPEGSCTSSL